MHVNKSDGLTTHAVTLKGYPTNVGFKASVNSAGEFRLTNSSNGAVLLSAGRNDREIKFGGNVSSPDYLLINGRRLYIQPNEPPRTVPMGSIWIKSLA